MLLTVKEQSHGINQDDERPMIAQGRAAAHLKCK